MAKKKKLTKEELQVENKKLREEIKAKNAGEHKDADRIVNSLSGKNLFAYTLILLLPIVGIWWLWHKREHLNLNNASMILWSAIGVIVLIQQVILIYNQFA